MARVGRLRVWLGRLSRGADAVFVVEDAGAISGSFIRAVLLTFGECCGDCEFDGFVASEFFA
jgi:hypothetical protein